MRSSSSGSVDFAALSADAALVAHDLMAAQGCDGMAVEDNVPAAGGGLSKSSSAAEEVSVKAPESGAAPEPVLELAGAGSGRQQASVGELCCSSYLFEPQVQSC